VATQTLGKAHNLAESGVETLPVPTGGPAAGLPFPPPGPTSRALTKRAARIPGGRMSVIATIEAGELIRTILGHLGLPTDPPQAPAGPTASQHGPAAAAQT